MLVRNKKKVIFITALLLVVLIVALNRRNQEQEVVSLIDREKVVYALGLNFEFRIILHGRVFNSYFVMERISPNSEFFDPSFTDLVFVHNEAESVDFLPHVIVAWPRESDVEGLVWWTNHMVMQSESDLVNRGSRRSPISPEDLPLPLPITAADLVDNWEKVNAIWQMLSPHEQDDIRHFSRHGITAAILTSRP